MTKQNRFDLLVALVAVVIAIAGFFYPVAPVSVPVENVSDYGAVGSRFPNGISIGATAAQTGKLTVGTDGTAFGPLYKGTCTLTTSGTIAATSTGFAQCAVTGLTAGDTVFVTLATTTTAIANNWVLAGAKASTTASGSMDVKLMNLTGTAAAIPAAILSGAQYLIVR